MTVERMELALSKIDDAIEILHQLGLTDVVGDLIAASENLQDEITNEISAGEYDGQPDEAQEWHDFDPDC